jgi:hypothetical protein
MVTELAGFLDGYDFAAFVVAALDAGAVRHFSLMAVGALRE